MEQRVHRRLLFAAPVAAVALFALGAYRVERAVEAIEIAGGTVVRRPLGPPWMRRAVYQLTGHSPAVLDSVEAVSFRFHAEVDRRDLADVVSRMKVFGSLEALDLSGTGVDADVLRRVSRLSSLKRLDLSSADLADDDLAVLSPLEDLRRLSLAGTQISDAGLEHLLKLQQLEELDLDGTHVTDRGMRLLRKLPRLTSLSVSNTRVTDAGLEVLWETRPEVAVADD